MEEAAEEGAGAPAGEMENAEETLPVIRHEEETNPPTPTSGEPSDSSTHQDKPLADRATQEIDTGEDIDHQQNQETSGVEIHKADKDQPETVNERTENASSEKAQLEPEEENRRKDIHTKHLPDMAGKLVLQQEMDFENYPTDAEKKEPDATQPEESDTGAGPSDAPAEDGGEKTTDEKVAPAGAEDGEAKKQEVAQPQESVTGADQSAAPVEDVGKEVPEKAADTEESKKVDDAAVASGSRRESAKPDRKSGKSLPPVAEDAKPSTSKPPDSPRKETKKAATTGSQVRKASIQQAESKLRRASFQQERRTSFQQDRKTSFQQDRKTSFQQDRRPSYQQDRRASIQQDRRASFQQQDGRQRRPSFQQDDGKSRRLSFMPDDSRFRRRESRSRSGSIQLDDSRARRTSQVEELLRRRRLSSQASTSLDDEDEPEEPEDTEEVSEEPEEEQKKKKREKPVHKIPDNFFYKYDDVCPLAFVTPDSGVPTNLLQLTHSFGYDCTKRANLQLLDDQTIMYIAGSVAVILDLKTKERKYLRCCSGGGIGNIAVHYNKNYFAVAEKGKGPKIVIYEYPSLHPYRILKGGTEEAYAFADFNASGTLLASVGSSPDYMLTVWDWKQEKIVLRSKAFSQDVFRVSFSLENEEQLTTSGTGHIRFWKMALTFTGLKLQGALGRFGKTGLTDIEGYVELPDGKVVSGSEWGNMLLWEGGLIKVEFCRKGRKPCHIGNINQFVLDEGELFSIGADGYVRVWDFEVIDTAEAIDDTGILELEPMNELLVGKRVNLRSMVKVTTPQSHIWYAQDAYGAIWKLDLSFSNITQDPECLFSFHSGKIEGLDASPSTHLVATTALDHSVCIHDILGKSQLVEMKFKQGGTTLIWAPRMVNPKGGMFAVGFDDGVVRILEVYNPTGLKIVAGRTNTGDAEMRLKQAFKPHVAPVTAMAYDRNGELLATGSEDKTVFFFATGDKYEPIGFINVPGPVRQLQWSPASHEDNKLLVLCENGFAVEVAAPSTDSPVPAATYEIQGLPLLYFNFRSVKSKIQREQELIARQKRKEAKQKERDVWIAEQKELGIELTEEELAEKPEEEPPLPPLYFPEVPSPILCGFYSTPGRFWLSLGGYDSGFLYHCAFDHNQDPKKDPSQRKDEPLNLLPVEDTEENPIRKLYFSNNHQLLFCGMENGSVRVYPLEASDPLLSSMHGYWSLGIHDNQYGYIQAICSTYDNQFLVTCGADGNIFSFSIMSHEQIEKDMKEKRAKVPSPRLYLEKEKAPEDIDDPNAYSIESAKQKLEHDQMVKEAEEKKANKRQELSLLRNQFSELLMKNKELPEHMQLLRAEFEMDKRIREEMERLTSERIRTVLRELAWEQEKHRIGLQKLQTRFRSSVEFDTLVLRAIASSHHVSTYRLLLLSDKFYKVRGILNKKAAARFDLRQKESEIRDAQKSEAHGSTERKAMEEALGKKLKREWFGLAGKRAEKLEKLIQKSDRAKAKISQRKNEWEQLFKQKPSDNYEDPQEVTAIQSAAEHMGDFKLKTSPNYTVPENMRMTADRKRYQLAMLEEMIHEQKAAMNRWIVSLRDFKVATIEQIQTLVHHLDEIQSALDPSKCLPIPKVPRLHRDETPEKRFQYDDETLNKFRLAQEKKALSPEQQGDFGGFEGSQGGAEAQKQPGSQSRLTSSSKSATQISPVTPTEAADKDESGFTELEQEIMKVEEIRNIYHQQRIIKKYQPHIEKVIQTLLLDAPHNPFLRLSVATCICGLTFVPQINELVTTFDAELRLLRHTKMKMDLRMKMGDLRHITLFEELLFLKDFEKLEDKLQENVNIRHGEKEDIKWKTQELQQQLDAQKLAITKLQEREKTLLATFQTSLGENNKFAVFLTKVFKKKIKRSKKKETHGNEDEDEDSDEDSDDESGWESSDEDDAGSEDEPFDDTICPDNCDPALFENTLHLREKRLDIEEALVEERKSVDIIKKDYDALAKKTKGVEASLKFAETELEAFQREKQRKVNELLVVVPLRLHQVEHVISGEVPTDLSHSLVFTNHSLEGLQQRIRELQVEKFQQRDLYKQARQQHKQLIRDRREMETKILVLEDKCKQQMILKFGRLVDLETLQTLSVNINLEELKIQSLEKEMEMDKEIKEWESHLWSPNATSLAPHPQKPYHCGLPCCRGSHNNRFKYFL